MKNVQLNQTEVTLILAALNHSVMRELNKQRVDHEAVGRLAAIKYKVELAEEIPTTV